MDNRQADDRRLDARMERVDQQLQRKASRYACEAECRIPDEAVHLVDLEQSVGLADAIRASLANLNHQRLFRLQPAQQHLRL
jgi:hypothetical protein